MTKKNTVATCSGNMKEFKWRRFFSSQKSCFQRRFNFMYFPCRKKTSAIYDFRNNAYFSASFLWLHSSPPAHWKFLPFVDKEEVDKPIESDLLILVRNHKIILVFQIRCYYLQTSERALNTVLALIGTFGLTLLLFTWLYDWPIINLQFKWLLLCLLLLLKLKYLCRGWCKRKWGWGASAQWWRTG